ncbi:MAG: adenosylcobinamide-phosphate synthase CbiB [Thermaerobacterales bacterium]
MAAWMLLASYIIDRLLGDPSRLPHPVVLIGRAAKFMERLCRPPSLAPWLETAGGAVAAGTVIAGTYVLTRLLLEAMGSVFPPAAVVTELWLAAAALALRGLGDAGGRVARRLEAGDLPGARRAAAHLVARETAHLPESEVSRATVESVAENTSDGFVAPLFYAAVGGAPLALAYKAVNTLDSMFGYRDRRNLYFGRFAARLDDAANWAPARLTALLMAAVVWWSERAAGRRAWTVMRRDARRHPSPNAGYPEAAMAGALGVRLGGENVYGSRRSRRPYLGEGLAAPCAADIRRAVRMMYRVGFWAVLAAVAGRTVWTLTAGMGE